MRYLSVCSGIEAATVAWHPLGWTPAAFSEIEAFPSAVLAHHYPDTPNWGDMTKFQEWPDADVDVLVGGTPCQSFSVAGLRKGLEDDRGNLTLQFLKLAQRTNPEWIVWENVPGVLSDKTGALPAFLDGLEELGYICDIDILDAQFYGVPQRRRRVFVCGQHRDHLIAQRTDSSALTIAQCWQETLHGILVVQSRASESAPESSASASLSRDGVTRRMRLFGLLGESDSFETLRQNLAAAWQRSAAERNTWAARLGAPAKGRTADGRSTASQTDSRFTHTEPSLNDALAASYEVMKSFITSTTTSSITQTEIYTCSQAVLHIARLTLALNQSSPPFWSAASSSLTALRGFIDYARSTGSDLFAGVEWFRAWGDFLEQAVPLHDAFERVGIRSFDQVFPLADSLSGHSAPRREKGQRIAASLGASPSSSGQSPNVGNGQGTVIEDGYLEKGQRVAGYTPSSFGGYREGCGTLRSDGGDYGGGTQTLVSKHIWRGGDQANSEHCFDIAGTLNCDKGQQGGILAEVAHTLRGEGFDAGEDGTGRGTPIVPVAFNTRQDPIYGEVAQPLGAKDNGNGILAFTAKDHGGDASDISPTLRSGGHDGSHANGGVMPAVAFDTTQITSKSNYSNPKPGDACHPLAAGAHPPAVAIRTAQTGANGHGVSEEAAHTLDQAQGQAVGFGSAVRRLTPVECERLQGFPDNWTLVPYRNKPAADGPRYKALGNSMAVPVMRWIGERIQAVEALQTQAEAA